MDLIEPIWGISKSGAGCSSCSKQANENEGDEAKKKQQGATKIAHIAIGLCRCFQIKLDACKGWSSSRCNQSVSNLIGICSLDIHRPHTLAVLELDNARTFTPADRGSDTDRRGGLHHSGARQPGPDCDGGAQVPTRGRCG